MNINRENYESYFIDYIDGNLSTDQTDILLNFLSFNPDLASELNGIEEMKLNPGYGSTQSWDFLLKSNLDDQLIFNDTCIRYIEGDLPHDQQELLQQYIQLKPNKKHELELFKATKLKPDLELKFSNLNALKHRSISRFLWPTVAVAASVAVVMLLWFQPQLPNNLDHPVIAKEKIQNKTQPIEPSKIENNSHQVAKIESTTPKQQATKQRILNKDNNLALVEKKSQNSPIHMEPLQPRIELVQYEQVELAVLILPTEQEKEIEKNEPSIREELPLIANEISKIDLAKVALFSLKTLTNDKFDYATNQSGQVSKIAFNSRLLAFSIPVN